MFEDDDDFEIDEEFLDGIFDAEKSAIKSDTSLEFSRNNAENVLDSTFEPSPVKKRKSSPCSISCSSSQNKTDSALRTSEESVQLIALASQRRPSSQSIRCDERQVDMDTSNCRIITRNTAGSCDQSNAPGHFRKPISPKRHSFTPDKSPVLRNLSRDTSSSQASFTLNTSRVRQRKFPGPAGLLPERGRSHMQGQRPNFSLLLDTPESDLDEPEEPLCSQSSASVLEDGPWAALKNDLTGEGQALLRRYTVSWVKQKAAARQLIGQKVPFLAAVLHSIDCSSPDPCVVLRDPTGEIPGTLHRSVWDSFGGQLIAGSALVLRLVGVLSTGISARRHYLNITSNNIVTIYSSPLCESSAPDTPNKVRKTDVHKWTQSQLLQGADSWEEQSRRKVDAIVLPSSGPGHPNPFTPNLPINASGNFRPPLQISNQSNNIAPCISGFSTIRPTNQGPTKSNNVTTVSVSSSVKPQVPSVNRGVPLSSPVQGVLQNCDARRQENSASKTVSDNRSTAQSRFIPKRPTFPVGEQSRGEVLPRSSVACSQENSQTSVDLQSSRDMFSDADDIDISSVLDGIDSESLFGDF